MAPLTKAFLVSTISFLLLFTIHCSATQNDEDLDDDVAFLESQESIAASSSTTTAKDSHVDDTHEEHDEEESNEEPPAPDIDEKDVVVLREGNFSEFIGNNRYVMVEFYAPWCSHCQALAPHYAAAATELKGEAVLAKVHAAEERELSMKYDIEGIPMLIFFVDGVHKAYSGERSKDNIVTWVKKNTGPSFYNVTTTEEAERILNSESKIVLGFLDSLVGPESEELAAASKSEDDVSFYQTSSPEVAKLFHIEPQVRRPALVLLKKEEEKLSHFDGQFSKSAITEFVSANKLPLVISLTVESASLIFNNPIKKQLFLFATSDDSEKIIPAFQEAAKSFKRKLVFSHVDMDDEVQGRQVADYFGVTHENGPSVIVSEGPNYAKKYRLDGEFTLSNIKSFVEEFLKDKLKPFYKSEPVPESNDGDVKIVVGKNFDEIVLDESKDVLLEIYAPGAECGYCQKLEPIYNRLAKYLRGIDSLVIAKFDGTKNEHPRAKAQSAPTFLFFPAGNKSSKPITVKNERTVVALYKFLKKHVSIPFKLQKPAASNKNPNDSEATDSNNNDVKDEL